MPIPATITWEQGLNAFVRAVYPAYPWAGAACGMAVQAASALAAPADIDPAPTTPTEYRDWLSDTFQAFAAGSASDEVLETCTAMDSLFLPLTVDSAWNLLFADGLVAADAATAGSAASPVLAPNKDLFPAALAAALADGVV